MFGKTIVPYKGTQTFSSINIHNSTKFDFSCKCTKKDADRIKWVNYIIIIIVSQLSDVSVNETVD